MGGRHSPSSGRARFVIGQFWPSLCHATLGREAPSLSLALRDRDRASTGLDLLRIYHFIYTFSRVSSSLSLFRLLAGDFAFRFSLPYLTINEAE